MENARTKNFSSEEINILVSLVKKYSHILENKKSDNVKPDQKEKAWKSVELEYNAVCPGRCRSMKILKTKYCNLKSELKKRSAEEIKSLYQTGGGPPIIQGSGEFDVVLREIVPEQQVHGNKSSYDCDTIAFETVSVSNDMNEKHPFGVDEDATCKSTLSELDQTQAAENKKLEESIEIKAWENYTPQQLKTKKTQKLCFEGEGKSRQSSWTKLAAVKTKWSNEKMSQEVDFAKAEHMLRMQQMKDMHDLQSQMYKMQMECLIEKHEIEMRILKEKSLREPI